MSRGTTPTTSDYMKTEDYSTQDDPFSNENNKKPHGMSATSCLEKLSMSDHQKAGLRQTNDLSQTIGLFRKYLLAKAQPNAGRTNMEESEDIKRKSPRSHGPLMPPNFSSNLTRRTCFLEQQIIPGFTGDATEANSADAKSSKEQLTIFYQGTVHVYDNIPVEKVQAIMLLAEESNLSKPLAAEIPKTERKTPLNRSINLQSICKLQAGLPIARKKSLQHFLERRRQRIVKKSPYVPLTTKEPEKNSKPKSRTNNNIGDSNYEKQSLLSLSPFPSRLGYFLPKIRQQGRLKGHKNIF